VSRSRARRSGGAGAPGPLARLGSFLGDFVFGRSVDDEVAARLGEIKGLCLIGGALLLLLALVSFHSPYGGVAGRNWAGLAGHYLASMSHACMGWSSFLLVLLSLGWGGVLLGRKKVALPVLRLFGGACFLASTAFLLQLAFGESVRPGGSVPYGPGGYLAMELVGPDRKLPIETPFLIEQFGSAGLWVLLVLLSLVSFALATDMAFYPAISAFLRWAEENRRKRGQSLPRAIAQWSVATARALWDFLRGADLERVPADAAEAAELELKPAKRRRRARAASEDGDEDEDESSEAELEAAAEASPGRKRSRKRAGAASALSVSELDAEDEVDEDETDELEPAPLSASARKRANARAGAAKGKAKDEDEDETADEDDELEPSAADEDEDESAEAAALEQTPALRPAPKLRGKKEETSIAEPPTPPAGPWRFPPLELLEPPTARTNDEEKNIEASALKLEQALASFRVDARVVGAKVGPTVTLFELEVAQGTRMKQVTQLSSEIAAALRARSVRIIAPIPGKATIGIEVPNIGRKVVRISELITQKAYDPRQMALPLFLGMDTEGNPIVEDFARMPHLLIAGTTGSGKSVCVNTILASLLLTRSPHDVKLILIDPKMVELQMFSKVPHLMLPVVTDAKHATNVLLWAVEKMEGRYDLFKNAGVRNIKGYNALSEEQLRSALGEEWDEERTPRHVPYIVLVVDEMADLMMTAKKEAELAITRLAQKSRAVGIHVLVATQRPSTDVITGVIKGNLPTRIAFQVASKIDSRVILDASGAEKLLGQGDMLYTPPQSSQIKRVQGALVEDHELQAVVDFVCQESAPNFSQELVQVASGSSPSGAEGPMNPGDDDLWDDAVRVILRSKRGSASLLQRALGVGYTRASRLIDMMTAEGILGEFKGSKAREVLMELEDWEAAHGAPASSASRDGDGDDEQEQS
jgi:DNA segregation ATPase FtsK/SpoIIIE-like protein